MEEDKKCSCGCLGDGSIKSFSMRPLNKEEKENANWEKVDIKPVQTTFRFKLESPYILFKEGRHPNQAFMEQIFGKPE